MGREAHEDTRRRYMASVSAARDREPALVTFLVSASGVTLLGIGSAFWGLIAGSLTLLVLRAGLGARH
jgi:benzoate membrane transport protein